MQPIQQYTRLLEQIAPLRRDLVSDGFDQAVEILVREYPFFVHRYVSGSRKWTWKVPPKWTVHYASISNLLGEVIVDTIQSPLLVSSYSEKVDTILRVEELCQHVNVMGHLTEAVPYTYCFYDNNWGFNLTSEQRKGLNDECYRVKIDAEKEKGELKVLEWTLTGEEEEIFVIAAHLDHPYQANDGLSGVIGGIMLMERLRLMKKRHYTYKLLIFPETIGSVAWLSSNEGMIPHIAGGIFLDMIGMKLPVVLQKSYYGESFMDACLSTTLQSIIPEARIVPYRSLPGNDERQFNAPGVRIPMLYFARMLEQEDEAFPYPEYHSSYDNVDLISTEALIESVEILMEMFFVVENDYKPINLFKGEVFLSGLSGEFDFRPYYPNLLKCMDGIDGQHTVSHIAKEAGIEFRVALAFMDHLKRNNLVAD